MGNAPRVCESARRSMLRLVAAGAAAGLVGCDRGAAPWHETDVARNLQPLAFSMTDANTGAVVDARRFRGKIVMLTFGYTSCPDLCPLTLGNLATVCGRLGAAADQVRILFVTVDPARDSLSVLRSYTAAFSPAIIGLRGSADALASLARRFRVAYSVDPAAPGHAAEVSHSSLVYVFDRAGDARLLVSSMSTPAPDIDGTTADLRRLIAERRERNVWDRIVAMV